MGALVGVLFAAGLLIASGYWQPAEHKANKTSRIRKWLDDNYSAQTSVAAFVFAVVGAFLLIFTTIFFVSQTVIVAILFALVGVFIPIALVKRRAKQILSERQAAWPDAIDNLASAIRAGLSLPEAIAQLGERGPVPLRVYFAQFVIDYDQTGRFGNALDLLKQRVGDPTGDRVVESLRLARDVGGGDLGRVLRTLSSYLREDTRTRNEMEARQSWTVNAARLAVAAPWFVLLMMSFQPDVVSRFAVGAGPWVLIGSAATCIVAYQLMVRIGRLPTEGRILR